MNGVIDEYSVNLFTTNGVFGVYNNIYKKRTVPLLLPLHPELVTDYQYKIIIS
jgi:hypothetical protein